MRHLTAETEATTLDAPTEVVANALRRAAYDLLGDDVKVAQVFNVQRTAIVNWRRRHGIASAKPRTGRRSA